MCSQLAMQRSAAYSHLRLAGALLMRGNVRCWYLALSNVQYFNAEFDGGPLVGIRVLKG